MQGHYIGPKVLVDKLGGSRISGEAFKGVLKYKSVGFALLILSHFSQIFDENEIIWVSPRPNYFIFIGHLNK